MKIAFFEIKSEEKIFFEQHLKIRNSSFLKV